MSPGWGADREIARGASSQKKVKSLKITVPENRETGDYKVEHEHFPPHAPQSFKFGAADHSSLAAHLEKHLAITIPGRAKGTIASPESGEVGKGDDE
jgi:hypothetical protein